jgi:hypothetical protein
MLSALAVGNNGAIHGSWVVAGIGKWNGPVPLSRPNFAPPGANIAMAKQTDTTTTALTVGNNGALHVSWVDGTGAWNGPAPISPPNFAPPGAGIAMAKQTNNQLTALTIGNNGALHVSWVVGTGEWQGPLGISPSNMFQPGSPIAMAKQTNNILSALSVDKNGALHVSWVVDGGRWQGPVGITPPKLFPPGASIAMAKQNNELSALIVGNDGRLYRSWVFDGGVWNERLRGISAPFPPQVLSRELFSPGGGVAMVNFNGVMEALTKGTDGSIWVSWATPEKFIDRWSTPLTEWKGPVRILGEEPPPCTIQDFRPPGRCSNLWPSAS